MEEQDKAKTITIAGISSNLYAAVKTEADVKGLRVVDVVTAALESYFDNNSEDLKRQNKALEDRLQEADSEIKSLKEQIEALKADVQFNDTKSKEAQGNYEALQESEAQLSAENAALKLRLSEAEERSKTLFPCKTLDKLLLDKICAQETARMKREITVGELLLTMFRNYTVKGEIYFFKTPSWTEIRRITEQAREIDEAKKGE